MGRSRRCKETDEQKCHKKLRHVDYLTALLHARAIPTENLVIYPCIVCDGLHVGHDKIRYAAHCDRECKVKVAALLRRIRTHERVIEESRKLVVRLREEMESIIVYYGCCLDAD
jgi:hypothetical protein